MNTDANARLIDSLSAIVNEVTENSDLPADDPALLDLRRILLHRIDDLRAAKFQAEANLVRRKNF